MTIDFEEVSVTDLAKSYGPTLALTGVNLSFEAGTVTLIQGANGSGKSTLLWLLALLARPSRGQIRYGRYGAEHADLLRGRIGFLAHQLQLYPGLTGKENLELAAKLHEIPDGQERVDRMRAMLKLDDYWDRPLRTYSRGQAQRIAIARTLLHEPRLLLMDEPSTGLDASSAEALLRLTEAQKARGAIIIIVSHELHFAKEITDRVLQLRRGRLMEAEA